MSLCRGKKSSRETSKAKELRMDSLHSIGFPKELVITSGMCKSMCPDADGDEVAVIS